jgi:hypothetical protein
MSKNQISFFATKNDLLSVIYKAAEIKPFYFSRLGDIDGVKVYENPSVIDDLSKYSSVVNRELNSYLLIDPMDVPITRSVVQKNGVMKYFFDQMSHPKSIFLNSGGEVVDMNCMISGQIGTITNDEWSLSLYKLLLSLVKKKFKKVKSFYLGDESYEKLKVGYRLMVNIKSHPDYDLKI